MKPCLIYFKEISLSDDNKFTLDFSDQEFVQEDFFSDNDYYITSLDYKSKIKKHIHADKKKKN